MSYLKLSSDLAKANLLKEFSALGYAITLDCLIQGKINFANKDIPIQIEIGPNYPYKAPLVKFLDSTATGSWHYCEPAGTLCLWSPNSSSDLPWLSAAAIIHRVESWLEDWKNGWVDEDLAMDLENYWMPHYEPLILYTDLKNLTGSVGNISQYRTTQGAVIPECVGFYSKKDFSKIRHKHVGPLLLCLVLDFGEISKPITEKEEILSLAKTQAASKYNYLINGRIHYVIIKYTRKAFAGALALKVTKNISEGKASGITFNSVESAQVSAEQHLLRQGHDGSTLKNKSVALIGAGAVGGVIADLMVRSGLGQINVYDSDRLKPGNLIRHVLPETYLGIPKSRAIQLFLASRWPHCKITAYHSVEGPLQAAKLFEDNDLVIDASANEVIHNLLIDSLAHEHYESKLISVCLLSSGEKLRIDRFPLKAGEKHAETLEILSTDQPSPQYESGCGDPVSPTTMWVITEAASKATGMAVDLLSDRNLYPPSIIQNCKNPLEGTDDTVRN